MNPNKEQHLINRLKQHPKLLDRMEAPISMLDDIFLLPCGSSFAAFYDTNKPQVTKSLLDEAANAAEKALTA